MVSVVPLWMSRIEHRYGFKVHDLDFDRFVWLTFDMNVNVDMGMDVGMDMDMDMDMDRIGVNDNAKR